MEYMESYDFLAVGSAMGLALYLILDAQGESAAIKRLILSIVGLAFGLFGLAVYLID